MFGEKRKNQLWSIILVLIGILVLVSLLFSTLLLFFSDPSDPSVSPDNYIGKFGTLVSASLYRLLGLGAFLIPVILIWVGIKKAREGRLEAVFRKGIGLLIFFIAFSSSSIRGIQAPLYAP